MSQDTKQTQIERLQMAGVSLNESELSNYLEMEDVLPIENKEEDIEVPPGFKRCGGCKEIKKLYMFNKNNATKDKATGNCKACQKKAAAASYKRNKHKLNYKKYYRENKERKLAHSKKYYEKNKEEVLAKQKEYHQSAKGKKVMRKAHTKRRKLMRQNKGIPYQRDWVIDRDKLGGKDPICYLCNETITELADIHLDHVVPVVIGGLDCFSNVACTHEKCNLTREKDARNLTPKQIDAIVERAEEYIDDHPELFGES